MVLCFGRDLFPRVSLHEDFIQIAHTACKLFYRHAFSSRTGLLYEKSLVSKGYHNIQTYLPFVA